MEQANPQLYAQYYMRALYEQQQKAYTAQLLAAQQQRQFEKLGTETTSMMNVPSTLSSNAAVTTQQSPHSQSMAALYAANGARPHAPSIAQQTPIAPHFPLISQQYQQQQIQQLAALQHLAHSDPYLLQQLQVQPAISTMVQPTAQRPLNVAHSTEQTDGRKRKTQSPMSRKASSSLTSTPVPAGNGLMDASRKSSMPLRPFVAPQPTVTAAVTPELQYAMQHFMALLQHNVNSDATNTFTDPGSNSDNKKARMTWDVTQTSAGASSVPHLQSLNGTGLRLPTVPSPKPIALSPLPSKNSPIVMADIKQEAVEDVATHTECLPNASSSNSETPSAVETINEPTKITVESSGTVIFAAPSSRVSSATPTNEAPAKISPARDCTSTATDGETEDPVDVVGNGSTSSTIRPQRRAHIEFYRKLKAFRNREKSLECQLCQESVDNSECNLRSHVHQHSLTPLFVCRICQATSFDQHRMFEHISSAHPGKDRHSFEDRRDMSNLSELLSSCFPKNPKSKASYIELIDRLLKHMSDIKQEELNCKLCNKKVLAQKSGIVRHLHTHPSYRCKKCKFMSAEENIQVEHMRTNHTEIADGTSEKNYNVCLASEVLSAVFKKCFNYALNELSPSTPATPTEETSISCEVATES
jgi:hypothetical protein